MASEKISQMPAISSFATGDLLPIVDISEFLPSDRNKSVTFGELFRNVLAGSASAPSIAFTGDQNTGIYSPGADQLALSTNGTGRLFVDANGRVHIGTTTSAHSYIQTIYGSTTGNRGAGTVYQNAATGTDASNGFLVGNSNGSDAYVWNYENANTIFATNGSERLRITSAGLVGVGTSAPSVPLEVTAATPIVKVSLSSDTTKFGNFYHSAGTTAISSRNGTSNGSIIFQRSDGTTTTTSATIDSSGRLGIGTSSPDQKLHVYDSGDVRIKASSGSGNHVELYAAYGDARTLRWNKNGSAGSFRFQDDGAAAVRMFIDSTGNVGIGTSTPGNYEVTADNLVISDNGDAGISIVSGASNRGNLFFADGTAGNDKFRGYIQYSHTDNDLRFGTNAQERFRCDSSGRLLVGTSSSLGQNSAFQTATNSSFADSRNAEFLRFDATEDTSGPFVYLTRSKSDSIGTAAAVNANDGLGGVRFAGAVSSSAYAAGAEISAWVDSGTVSATSLPTRLEFSVTQDGSASPTEALRITNDRYVRLASGTGGIQFNGDTAAANALDDYEEGTWTPVATRYTGSVTATYNYQHGRYIKVGRFVFVSFSMSIASVSAQTGSLSAVDGLPYLPTAGYEGTGSISANTALSTVSVISCNASTDFGGGLYLRTDTRNNDAYESIDWTNGTLFGSCVYMTN